MAVYIHSDLMILKFNEQAPTSRESGQLPSLSGGNQNISLLQLLCICRSKILQKASFRLPT